MDHSDLTRLAGNARRHSDQLADAVDTTATAADAYRLLADTLDLHTAVQRITARLAALHHDPTGMTDLDGDATAGCHLAAIVADRLTAATHALATAQRLIDEGWTAAGQVVYPDPPAAHPSSAPRTPPRPLRRAPDTPDVGR